MNEWWLVKIRSPYYKTLLAFIPLCICWELWKWRNKGRYEGFRNFEVDLIRNVEDQIVAAFNKSTVSAKVCFTDIAMLRKWGVQIEQIRMPKITATKWIHPSIGRVKLNSDGCSRGNPGASGGGAILRSSDDILWAIADYYEDQTNMVVEARALLQELSKRKREGRGGGNTITSMWKQIL